MGYAPAVLIGRANVYLRCAFKWLYIELCYSYAIRSVFKVVPTFFFSYQSFKLKLLIYSIKLLIS